TVGRSFPTTYNADRAFPEPVVRAFMWACSILGRPTVLNNFPNLFGYLRSGGDVADPGRLMSLYATTHVEVENEAQSPVSAAEPAAKMYYKISKCHQLMLDTTNHYDLVIRIRPDLEFGRAFSLDFGRIYFECNRQRRIFA